MPTILKRIQSLLISFAALSASIFSGGAALTPEEFEPRAAEAGDYCRFVDPFIGTGGVPWCSGNVFPGAFYPFGSVKLSPDACLFNGKRLFGWGTAAYYYGDSRLLGFSHTRLSGAGASDLGHFRVTPVGENADCADRLSKPLRFSHKNEEASPGYYRVYLKDVGCTAELTASARVGVHRYTFGGSSDARLLIDSTSLLDKGSVKEGSVCVDAARGEITGGGRICSSLSSRYGGLTAYYAAKFDRPFKSFATWGDGGRTEGARSARGDDCGAEANFGNLEGKSVELKLAISYVSVENARENLEAETGGLDFDAVRRKAVSAWNSYLSRIDIRTSDPKIKTIFYTALYRSAAGPAAYSDVNGEYRFFDGGVGTAEGFTFRSDMSLWDTFRTAHPLYTLIAPEIQTDSLKSLVAMARAAGVLPRWPSGTGCTGCMFGSPADMVIAESYLKGTTDFDAETAFEYMKLASDASVPGRPCRDGAEEYNALGYVSTEYNKSVSRTLEYSRADYSIALFARALGKTDDAEKYFEKSKNYKNLFDEKTKYFRGKDAEGKWSVPFSPRVTTYYDEILPIKFASPYCEGSAAHWRWAVPQDAEGLVSLFGDEKYFTEELEKFMRGTARRVCPLDPGAMFWLGNEHDFHAPYLFGDAGRPDLTQKWVRFVLDRKFGDGPDGLDGNDDFGATSAWYVWSATGLFPVAGTDEYWIGSPNVDCATIRLGSGGMLRIIAENQSKENVYVERVEINGRAVKGPRIAHDVIAGGGTIRFFMSARPAL